MTRYLLQISDEIACVLMDEYNINLKKSYGGYLVNEDDHLDAVIAINLLLKNECKAQEEVDYAKMLIPKYTNPNL